MDYGPIPGIARAVLFRAHTIVAPDGSIRRDGTDAELADAVATSRDRARADNIARQLRLTADEKDKAANRAGVPSKKILRADVLI